MQSQNQRPEIETLYLQDRDVTFFQTLKTKKKRSIFPNS